MFATNVRVSVSLRGEVVSREAHNLEVAGSNPAAANRESCPLLRADEKRVRPGALKILY